MANNQKRIKIALLKLFFLLILVFGIIFLFREDERDAVEEKNNEDVTEDMEKLIDSYCLEEEILTRRSHSEEDERGFRWVDENNNNRIIFGEEYFLRSDVVIKDSAEDNRDTVLIDENEVKALFLSSGCSSKILSYLEENFIRNTKNSDKDNYLLSYESGDIRCKYRHIHNEDAAGRTLLKCGDIKESILIEERETDVIREEMKEITEDLKRIQEILQERGIEE